MPIDRATLTHFGLSARGHHRSRITEMLETEIASAVNDRALCAVIGEFGTGKSTIVDAALRQAHAASSAVQIVRVQDPNRENQKISHVMNAAIYDLSVENPRRDAEARARQFIRVVGERVVRRRESVVIVIENAHRLHPRTLMAIKDAREMGFADQSGPLYSVLLVGQGRLREMLQRQPEIGHRTTRVELSEESGWMTRAERSAYLDAVYPGVYEAATRDRIAASHTTPLALDAVTAEAMRDARHAGLHIVDDQTVRLPIEQLVKTVDASYEAIGKFSAKLPGGRDIPKQTVMDVIKQGDNHADAERIRQAVDALRQQQKAAPKGMSLVA
jgi:type II secretory pathway predicted ATPase ExeA